MLAETFEISKHHSRIVKMDRSNKPTALQFASDFLRKNALKEPHVFRQCPFQDALEVLIHGGLVIAALIQYDRR